MTAPRWLAILGIGEDGIAGLTAAARALLANAEVVYGGARHLALARELIRGEARAWPSPMQDAWPALLALRPRAVAVLASGDPYCHGVGATLARLVPVEETLCLPAPSAFALACARLGWPAAEVAMLSLCGRPLATLIPHLQPGARLLVLSADATTPHAVADLLRARGFGASRLHVLEALGGPRERVRTLAASEALPGDIDRLNLLGIELRAAADALVLPLASGLPDDAFEHDGQLTKQEVRAVTLAALAPRQGEMLWDVGAGSGVHRHRVAAAPSRQPCHRHRTGGGARGAGGAQRRIARRAAAARWSRAARPKPSPTCRRRTRCSSAAGRSRRGCWTRRGTRCGRGDGWS